MSSLSILNSFLIQLQMNDSWITISNIRLTTSASQFHLEQRRLAGSGGTYSTQAHVLAPNIGRIVCAAYIMKKSFQYFAVFTSKSCRIGQKSVSFA